MKTLFTCQPEGAFPIALVQTRPSSKRYPSGQFIVTYGHDVKEDLSRDEAGEVLGSCILHALECTGEIE